MSNLKKIVTAVALSAGLIVTGAYAAQTSTTTGPEVASTAVTPASSFYHWQVRLRGIWVVPSITSSFNGVNNPVTNISNAFVPEFDINYFFNRYVSTELILGATRNTVHTIVGNGKVWLLPPTLTVLFHPLPGKLISPYFGAGINYIFFMGGTQIGGIDAHYDNAFGLALQAGVNVNIDQHWSVNFDMKKIFLHTDVHLNGAGTVNVGVNPWIWGAGVGYKF